MTSATSPTPSSSPVRSPPCASPCATRRPATSSQVSPDALHAALETVIDPEIRKPVTELGMVESVAADEAGHVAVTILLTVAACPLKDTLTKDTTAALAAVDGVTGVTVTLGVMSDEQRAELKTKLRGGVAEREVPFAKAGSLTRVYAVASGKGGVGKSSVTANLAAALAEQGSSTPTSTASRSPACSGSKGARPRSTT